jgi:sialate O-acetylesterase
MKRLRREFRASREDFRTMQRARLISATILMALSATAAHAEVRLPRVFGDHMVLQREQPIHVWGWADPAERVTVRFHDQNSAVQADDLGKWSAYLRPEQAGGPYTLSVSGTNTISLSDVLVGDVWFASGQSNMEFPLNGFPGSAVLKDGAREIAQANQPNLRLLRIEKRSAEFPGDDVDGAWTDCTPQTAAQFSAVAYFFGREIAAREHVPVGLIDSTWGGTPVSAWVSLDALASDAGLMPVFAARAVMADEQTDVPAVEAREKRENAAAAAQGRPAPTHPWHPAFESWEPAGLYNGMVAPFTPMRMKGAIWYQGESDSGDLRAGMYQRVFSAMIADWRRKWGEGDFPFLFAQISSFTSTPAETWGIVRDAQRRTLQLRDTGMAVTLDIGQADNVHPPDKQTVGARLALAARALAYGETGLEYSGPLFREADVEGSSVRVWFTHAAGLTARGGALTGFELAGADGRYSPAQARIDGQSIVVTSAAVPAPRTVRYAWANYSTANLYNGAGLPASTFTSAETLPQPCACTR